MKLIRDLICSSTPFGEMYTDNDLIGTIIMDDNKLEGILRDDFEKEYLAFGKVNDDTVEIILSSNSDKEKKKKKCIMVINQLLIVILELVLKNVKLVFMIQKNIEQY